MLGNLNDNFSDSDFEKIDLNNLQELEQYMLHKLFVLDQLFHKNFKSYTFHNLYKELLNFCTVDLSSFYFDIRKDLLYCDSLNSINRTNCIKILNVILECLLKWFAPILSFTTEEIFSLINNKNDSIHLKKFVKIPNKWKNEELNRKWNYLLQIRDKCNISIENKRASKLIGSSLEADLKIKVKKNFFEYGKNTDFSELCITSYANLTCDEKIKEEIQVETSKALGKKCPVCWKIRKEKCERHGKLE